MAAAYAFLSLSNRLAARDGTTKHVWGLAA
jgi:hypothetical protein